MTIHLLGPIGRTTHYGLEVDRVIKKVDDSDAAAWAMVASGAVLGGSPPCAVAQAPTPACRRIVLRSGRPDANETGAGGEGAWKSWSPRGKAAFEAEADRLAAAAAGLGVGLVLWPRVGEALSDIPSCLSFLRRYESGPFRLMVEPAALLAESMLPRAAEHLERIVDSLADHPGVAATMASGVEFRDGHGESVPLGRGSIPRGLLNGMVSRLGAIGKPLVVLHGDDATAIAGIVRPA